MPPLKARPLTVKPLITDPTTTPWLKVASREPPKKARSQNGRCDGVALEAKLKGDAAKNQADQHQGQGDRRGVDDHRA